MKAVFSVGSDDNTLGESRSYDIAILFNGMPGKVVLEITRQSYTEFKNGAGPGEQHASECVMRTVLEASHARAISSALLSAATEAAKK